MSKYVIHPLVVGINETDQGIMTYQKGYGKRIYLPIYVFYLEGGGQKILAETARGTAVITGFCCNATNFPSVGPAVTPGVHLNAIETYESAQRVKELADIPIPIHDTEIGRSGKIPA